MKGLANAAAVELLGPRTQTKGIFRCRLPDRTGAGRLSSTTRVASLAPSSLVRSSRACVSAWRRAASAARRDRWMSASQQDPRTPARGSRGGGRTACPRPETWATVAGREGRAVGRLQPVSASAPTGLHEPMRRTACGPRVRQVRISRS